MHTGQSPARSNGLASAWPRADGQHCRGMLSVMAVTLSGRKALVTGASRGVGAAIAEELARQGASVAINYRSKAPRAEAVAERIRALGGDALLVQADITSREEMTGVMTTIERDFGQ